VAWRFGEFELDPETRELRCAGRPVPLTPKALRLLELLLRRQPAAVSRQEIRDALWPRLYVADSNLPSLVWELRSALGDRPRGRILRTVRGFGYAFSGEVKSRAERSTRADGGSEGGLRLVWGDRSFALQGGENRLGRGSDVEVLIDAASVSRHHALIVVAGSTAVLEDLGSKNGTRLNGEPVGTGRELRDGDEIRLGTVQLLFRSLPRDAATATARG